MKSKDHRAWCSDVQVPRTRRQECKPTNEPYRYICAYIFVHVSFSLDSKKLMVPHHNEERSFPPSIWKTPHRLSWFRCKMSTNVTLDRRSFLKAVWYGDRIIITGWVLSPLKLPVVSASGVGVSGITLLEGVSLIWVVLFSLWF